MVAHADWEVHPARGYDADATRRNMAPGDSLEFHDMVLSVVAMSAATDDESRDSVGVELLPLLDGTRNRADLIQVLEEKDILDMKGKDGQPVKDREEIRRVLAQVVEEKLNELAQAALLTG